MRLPGLIVITREKLTDYLLVRRPRNDKSGYLRLAGYDVTEMKLDLYTEVALARDVPEYGLKRGDVATLVDFVPATSTTSEPGCVLEVFNAVGRTVAVVAVPLSAVEPLTSEEIFSVRPFEAKAAG